MQKVGNSVKKGEPCFSLKLALTQSREFKFTKCFQAMKLHSLQKAITATHTNRAWSTTNASDPNDPTI